MDHQTIADFARKGADLPGGVVTAILCESALHLDATAQHAVEQGSSSIVALGRASAALGDPGVPVIRIAEDPSDRNVPDLIPQIMDALEGRWVLWLWNGEFFHFPFCETRTLGDLAEFLDAERRKLIYTYAFDLYADPLPGAQARLRDCEMHFDRIGYYAFPEQDQTLKVYGALGWRFEEIAPSWMRQIGRASLVRAERGMDMKRDLHFEDPDFASVSCPWHRSPTAAMMSLRATRRILAHPAYPGRRGNLIWHGSVPFEWTSRQLLDLGMIEPGQWF